MFQRLNPPSAREILDATGARFRRRRSRLGTAMALAVALVTVGSAGPSSAEIPPLVAESTHPGFFQFEMGPAISLHKFATQFKMAMAGGYHLFGTGDGPALGASMQFGFSDGYFSTAVGPRFWWDIQVVDGLGLYLTPVAQVGYSLLSNGSTNHYLHLQFGFEPRLVLSDRGVIFLRFFTMDVMFGSTVAARYDLMFGGGVTF